MKLCSHCGKEIMDEAVVCPGCWCPVQTDKKGGFIKESEEDRIQRRKKRKEIAIIIIAVLLCGVILGVLVRNKTESDKREEIIRVLSAREFSCEDEGTYAKSRIIYSFDDKGNCHVQRILSLAYDSLGMGPSDITNDYIYSISFSGKRAYIEFNGTPDALTIKFDEDGDIIALYDPKLGRTYK